MKIFSTVPFARSFRDTWCISRTPRVLFPFSPAVGSHVYTPFFACVTCTRVSAACVTRRGAFAYWWLIRTNKHARETSETERRMRARGTRHCKRMLIIFTSCNSVTLNHRQATSLPLPLFRVIIVFLLSRYCAIAIITDAATCDSRRGYEKRNLSASSILDVADYEIRTRANCHVSIAANGYGNR